MFEPLIIITMSLAIIINIIMSIFSFKYKKNYALFLGLSCLYNALVITFYVLSISFNSKLITSIFSSLYFICMDLLVVSLYIFTYWLVEGKKTKIFKIIILIISIVGIIDISLLIINIFKPIVIDYELAFDLFKIAKYKYVPHFLFNFHLTYVYAIVTLLLCALIKKAIIVPLQYKVKYLIVVIGIILCAFINFLFLILPQKNTNPYWTAALNVDYALLGYSILAMLCYYAALLFPEKGMLNGLKTEIFDNINQGLVLFDYDDNMILYNKKAVSFLGEENTINKPELNEFRKNCDLLTSNNIDDESYSIQCYIKQSTQLRCDYRCIKDKNNKTVGKLFVFADVQLETDLLTGFHNWDSFKKFAFDNKQSFPCNTSVAIVDINRLGLYNSLHDRSEGDKLLKKLSTNLKELFSTDSYYVRGNDASLIVICYNKSEDEITELLLRLKENFEESIQFSTSFIIDENDTIINAIKRAFEGIKAKKLLDKESSKSAIIYSLVKTLQANDEDTEAHVKRTQAAGIKLGEKLGLSDVDLSNLSLLCILHDIGKVAIPLEILNKPGKLTAEEWKIIKSHTIKGYEIAKSTPELEGIADMIKYHHERWDGTGYPDGLSLETIPLLSRIISVVDSYDAMINNRSYRKAKTIKEAKEEIIKCSGTQFDPKIAAAFIEMINEEAIQEDVLHKAHVVPLTHIEEPENVNSNGNFIHVVKYAKYILNSDSRIIEISKEFTNFTGYTKEDIKNNVISQIDLIPKSDRGAYLCLLNKEMANNPIGYFEHRLVCKDNTIKYVICFGRKYYDSAVKEERSEIIITNSLDTYAAKMLNVESEKKSQIRLKLWEETYRKDSLTGLLTHLAFENDVSAKILQNVKVTLLIIDIDFFKKYNDTYGHKAGDEFLIKIAQTIDSTIVNDGLSCRMGGDEFAIALFNDISNDYIDRIYNELNITIQANNGFGLSIGVSSISDTIKTFDELYVEADKALYKAKENGRNQISTSEKIK
ncbi:MAG: diguanylate cyclase [Erysipelotrichaceae bacterium]|nr:diguanylate cyclase [Erysipelotrichaceae bacterium]